MQDEKIKNILKATIFSLIVAFLIVYIICYVAIKYGKEKFLMATNIIDMITIEANSQEKNDSEIKFFEKYDVSVLLNPPFYGENYANLKIESIEVDLPIYYGKTIDLLKNGIGHDNDSYFPGEGGSIILMGHNYNKFLAQLPNIKVGDEIKIDTNYGSYTYKVYDTEIVNENDTYKLPIQKEEEILMIYTCWPINNLGYTTERYVVFAK